MQTLSTLQEDYRTAFQQYLHGAGEAALQRAYELGRKAVDEGLGILEMAVIHQEVLAKALVEAKPVDAIAVAKAAAAFFAECLSPFEITHRSYREANAALRLSEERYRRLFENAGDIVFTLDLDGYFTSINRAGERISGYSREEIPQVNLAQILAPEQLGLAHKMLDQKLAAGGSTTYEADILTKDGRRVTLEISSQLIYQDGAPIGVQGIARDITERKQAEEREREYEERLRLLVNGVKDYAIFLLDPEGHVATWNEGARRIKGYSADEILGRHFSCFYRPEDVEAGVPEENLRLAEAEGRVEDEGWRVRKDGSRFWANVLIAALRDSSGRLRGFAKLTRDLTERKHSEEAMVRMNEALEEQTRRIAHALHDESGQLLASVHIALEEIARGLPADARKRLQDVKGLLDQIEEQLRHFSHELRPTILDDLGLRPALHFLAERVARRTGVYVSVDCPKDVRFPSAVETALYRVVQEALNNVARHSQASRVKIQVRLKDEVIQGSVTDDGAGFDVGSVLNRRGESGLGLGGMQARLEALHGTFSVHSAPGQGTHILFTIPLERSDASQSSLSR